MATPANQILLANPIVLSIGLIGRHDVVLPVDNQKRTGKNINDLLTRGFEFLFHASPLITRLLALR
mgnify:CR=1 FL=1